MGKSAEVNRGTAQDNPSDFRVDRHEHTGAWTVIAPNGTALYTFADKADAIAEAAELNTPASVTRRRRTRFDPRTAVARAYGDSERPDSRDW